MQKLFRSSANELEIFNHVDDGYIDVEVEKNYAYQINVEDPNHKNRYLLVPLVGKEQEVAVPQKKRPEGKEIEPKGLLWITLHSLERICTMSRACLYSRSVDNRTSVLTVAALPKAREH